MKADTQTERQTGKESNYTLTEKSGGIRVIKKFFSRRSQYKRNISLYGTKIVCAKKDFPLVVTFPI